MLWGGGGIHVLSRKKVSHTTAAMISYRGLYQFFLLQQFHPAAIAMWAVIVARGKKWRRRPRPSADPPPLSADKIG